jgi:hypothetical protein
MKMTPRRAATIALLGWYLMIAPRNGGILKPFDFNAPLSKWEQGETYASKADCEKARSTQISERQDKSEEIKSRKTKRILQHAIEGLQHGQCVSADDPRLKAPQ